MAKQSPSKKSSSYIPTSLVGMIADEVAKTVVERLPNMLTLGNLRRRRAQASKPKKKLEQAFFLDTSAIIDGRVFEVLKLGLFGSVIVVPQCILTELKRIADSQDMVKRERGRRGLLDLEKVKKMREMKVIVTDEKESKNSVDDRLIESAKINKGKIITCDYNLSKKANIENVVAINMNTLANIMKIAAVPGETLHIKVLHVGKDPTQGVGYLDDGTMIVIEEGSSFMGQTIDVVISRVLQTEVGRILFGKRI